MTTTEKTDLDRYQEAYTIFIRACGKLGEALLEEVGGNLGQAIELMQNFQGKYADQKAFVRHKLPTWANRPDNRDSSTINADEDRLVQDIFGSGQFLSVDIDGKTYVFERNQPF